MSEPLWQPTPERVANARITAFRDVVQRQHDVLLPDNDTLHRWSVENSASFWRTLWDFTGVVGEPGEILLVDGDRMPGARWFPEARLNYAENLLRRRGEETALVFRGEDQVRMRMTWRTLYERVGQVAEALRALGVVPGDRVAGYLPNMPETIVAMLGAAAVGATWSSCSPDFGVRGVLDRFGQIAPKVLFTADGYYYNGKTHDSLANVRAIVAGLPTVERVVVVPYTQPMPDLDGIPGALMLGDFLDADAPAEIRFARLPFDHPLFIMFSSGTTGAPKCIVHGAGGTLLKHLCEQQLHCDLKRDDRLFFFTTCGWMMWNWLASGLASSATLLLYDGSPFYPGPQALFDYADAERATLFGTSAKFLDAIAKAGLKPRETHDLGSVETLISTGSPLSPEGFDYVYRDIKQGVCLSSVSGGTDIMGCFVLGDPTRPVHRGEIQCRALGLDVHAYDDDGHPVIGEKGELVCTNPFPSMPIGFWNDTDGSRYRGAYFEGFPGVWTHGDFVEFTERGGAIIYGRSDAVLNPGGVRIGTAEIYRVVEQLAEVIEGLVIGQQWENDVRVVLFVRLAEGVALDAALVEKIRGHVRRNCTPRHVPAKVLAVADIPRTKSGKIVELAVRDIVHGREVKNREALANPEALALFRDRPELAE